MTALDENCPPLEEDADLSMESVKAGAAVFGSLVFGTEFPEHSLTYSPSPCRYNKENTGASNLNPSFDSSYLESKEAIDFDKHAVSPKKRKEKVPHKKELISKNEKNKVNFIKSKDINKKRIALKERSGNILAERSDSNESVNPVINGVRRSKEECVMEKQLTAAEIRDQRRLEKQEAEAFNAEAEKTRREVLELRKQLSARFRRAQADRQRKLKEEQLSKVENEIQFKSMVHVEHKKTIKEMEDARRRMSTDARAKLRQNNREGKERLRLASIQEDQALYQERHESSLAIRNTNEANAESRRKSFAFRNGDARRIRQLHAEMEREEMQAQHESYELKWAGERDAEEYKKQLARERRESLELRNANGRRIREHESNMMRDEQHNEHESYELKWAGERDAEEYKMQLARERRESLALRNAEGMRIRDLEAQMKDEQHNEHHESYELKWAGERDAEEYKKQLARERRESLALRNVEGVRIRDLEAQMKANDFHNEHESYELKWAGERDADEYKKQLARERRESFELRNAEGRHARDVEATMKANEWQKEHESYELKWAGERDAEEYKKQLARERRESLAFRNAEAARHDAVMAELLNLAREKEHESYMLQWAGENDAKKYMADQEELRRQSLAFRNAEGRRHREIDEEMKRKVVMENAENEAIAAACQRDVQQYKSDCAARDRASFCLRGKEHFSTRLKEENDRQLRLDEEHESHLLDTAAWQDVNEYVEECKRRKRLSLAFRAKEKRRHFEYEKKQRELKIQQQHADTNFRSEDARYIEMAKLKEKARIALESFKHSPNCSFGANPFDTVLR
eukprot:CAMPEP_0171446618 /NCGR_PEP_ID=MMETSP0881-20121228/38688_1 /TAXON_ID=67004 /ORGANISM="Thalassiosira weissflogii, Strain CCMP1336" /LENGTH=810 /DNA_ID=CAMNT_0011971011 /DNA_START=223 /DNA_END=2656 /DNA_ORIENTATION=+